KHLKTGMGYTCVCDEGIPERSWETVLERFGPARVDVDLVTLQPTRIGAPRPLFVNSNADAGLSKTLRKAQPADPAANDDYAKSHGWSILMLNARPHRAMERKSRSDYISSASPQ